MIKSFYTFVGGQEWCEDLLLLRIWFAFQTWIKEGYKVPQWISSISAILLAINQFYFFEKKIRLFFCDEFASACQEFAIAAIEVGSTYLHKIEGLFLLCQLSQRKKSKLRSQIDNKNTYGWIGKSIKRGQILHCATVEIPHCVGSCAANPIGLLSVFGTLRNYCLVPLLAYAFTRERLIHNSGLTGGDP